MRLRDKLTVTALVDTGETDWGGEPIVEERSVEVPAYVWWQSSTDLVQSNRPLGTVDQLRAIVGPLDRDTVAATDKATWHGQQYKITGRMDRMQDGTLHHVTLNLEQVSG